FGLLNDVEDRRIAAVPADQMLRHARDAEQVMRLEIARRGVALLEAVMRERGAFPLLATGPVIVAAAAGVLALRAELAAIGLLGVTVAHCAGLKATAARAAFSDAESTIARWAGA